MLSVHTDRGNFFCILNVAGSVGVGPERGRYVGIPNEVLISDLQRADEGKRAPESHVIIENR